MNTQKVLSKHSGQRLNTSQRQFPLSRFIQEGAGRQQAQQLWVVSPPASCLPWLRPTATSVQQGKKSLHTPWVLLQGWGASSWDPSAQHHQKLWVSLPWECFLWKHSPSTAGGQDPPGVVEEACTQASPSCFHLNFNPVPLSDFPESPALFRLCSDSKNAITTGVQTRTAHQRVSPLPKHTEGITMQRGVIQNILMRPILPDCGWEKHGLAPLTSQPGLGTISASLDLSLLLGKQD